jgi:hypothetical protein
MRGVKLQKAVYSLVHKYLYHESAVFWVATPCRLERELEMWVLHNTFIFRAEQYAKQETGKSG